MIYKDSSNTYHIKGSHHRIKIPKMSKDMALFLGLMCGDGWIAERSRAIKYYDWRIGIVEDDRQIIELFINLSKKLFNIDAHFHERKKVNAREGYFSSKIIHELLIKKYEIPDGEKINRLKIPREVKPLGFIGYFLKGLYSTDGCIYLYKGYYPRISVATATLNFAVEIRNTLVSIGLNPQFQTRKRIVGNNLYSLRLNGVEQATLFSKQIGFVGKKAKILKDLLEKKNT